MTGSRSHRSLKTRFLFIGLASIFVASVFYVYMLREEQSENLHRCRAEQSTLSAQLRAVIDYRERMEHSLTIAKNQHQDAITALHTQQEEQTKLTKNHIIIQNMFNNLTEQYGKLKHSAESDRKMMQTYKDQYLEFVTRYEEQKRKFEEANVNTKQLIDKLKVENIKLNTEVQRLSDINQHMNKLLESNQIQNQPEIDYGTHNFTPVYDINKNVNSQVKLADDRYALQKANVNELGVKQITLNGYLNNSKPDERINNPELKSGEGARPEIPQGVAPELPVEDNSNVVANKLENDRYKAKVDEGIEQDKYAKAQNKDRINDLAADAKKDVNVDLMNEIEMKFDTDKKKEDDPNYSHNNRDGGDNGEDDDDEYRNVGEEPGDQ